MSEHKPSCPGHAREHSVKLVELKAPTYSGHTHQCPECSALYAPYGLEDKY